MRRFDVDKMTRDLTRTIEPGETVLVCLPSYRAVEAARVTIRQAALVDGREFRTWKGGDVSEIFVERKL